MSSAFCPALSNDAFFTRKWGTDANVVEPYITGYSFARFYLPSTVLSTMGIQEAPSILNNSMLGHTVPTGSIETTSIQGLGGVQWVYPTHTAYSNECSFKFLETYNTPIREIIHDWIKIIGDYRTGVAWAGGKNSFAGTAYYFTTDPTMSKIQFAICYGGIFPDKDPMDSFGHDIASNDKLEIDVSFKFDYPWQESWVWSKCQNMIPDKNIGNVFAPQ